VDRGASPSQRGHRPEVARRRPSGAGLLGGRDLVAAGLPAAVPHVRDRAQRDDTVSIFTTDVDPAVEDGSPAATSRTYAVAAQQIFDNPVGLLPTGSYNAELIVRAEKRPQA
jgi:hypothetical protein